MIRKDHDTYNAYLNDYLKLSVHFNLGLPIGLFPFISPTKIFLFVLSRLISSILIFHFFCLLFTISRTPFCRSFSLTSTFLTLSNLLTPLILLKTFICVACIFDCCRFDRLHVLHLYINVGITVAFTTSSLILFSSFLLCQHCAFHSSLQSLELHSQSLPPLPCPYSHHY